jgi:hypothetical protein
LIEKHPVMNLKHADDAVGVHWLRTDDKRFLNRETFHEHHKEFVLAALFPPPQQQQDENN